MKKILILSMVAFLVFSFTSHASADYLFTYVSDDKSVNASGMLNTTPNGNGSFQVTAGSLGAATLVPGTAPSGGSLIGPSGAEAMRFDYAPFRYDNLLSPASSPMLTGNGLLFREGTFGSNSYKEINIFWDTWQDDTGNPMSGYKYSVAAYSLPSEPGGFGLYSSEEYPGTFTATAAPVPIPAAVWLLGTGLVGLLGVRRRFRAQAQVQR